MTRAIQILFDGDGIDMLHAVLPVSFPKLEKISSGKLTEGRGGSYTKSQVSPMGQSGYITVFLSK